VLASRVNANKPGRKLEGDIEIRSSRIRYVQQEESLVGVLTARETLVFAAKLAGAPLELAESLLGDMGLSSAADTQVGTIFSKGMSGGQKRRLSIAIELVSNPCLLFLDEPTSGTFVCLVCVANCLRNVDLRVFALLVQALTRLLLWP
jgi:ABC-type multidrug transport system ATPase subunit